MSDKMADANPTTAAIAKEGEPEVESRSINRYSTRDDNEKGDFEHDEVANVTPFKVSQLRSGDAVQY